MLKQTKMFLMLILDGSTESVQYDEYFIIHYWEEIFKFVTNFPYHLSKLLNMLC